MDASNVVQRPREQGWTAKGLAALPTLAVGQTCDLKVEREYTRVWLSRCTVDDGMPYNHAVTVERFDGFRWNVVSMYPG